MWNNPNIGLPLPIPPRPLPEEFPVDRGSYASDESPPSFENNTVQRLLAESAAEELTRQLADPVRASKIDFTELVSIGVASLSGMAAELGIILRLQIRGERIQAVADGEKVRRAVNALMIHLLTVSQSEGWMTIGLEDQLRNGRRGCRLLLVVEKVPWKTNPEYESELETHTELALCRKILEKQGGSLAVAFQDEKKLAYEVWLPG